MHWSPPPPLLAPPPQGTEALVRFVNRIAGMPGGPFSGNVSPCVPSKGRAGIPLSIHYHGAASLAPYDGWAEDEICKGEGKDYVYPGNRAGTGW